MEELRASGLAAASKESTEPESLGLRWFETRSLAGGRGDRDQAIEMYEANVKAVKATVAPERLLVHTLGDGWEPRAPTSACRSPQPTPAATAPTTSGKRSWGVPLEQMRGGACATSRPPERAGAPQPN